MNIRKPAIASTQIVLLFPAALFMIALLARYLQPLIYEPAHAAQLIVMWYSGRIWTLWLFLIGLPLVVLGLGCITLLNDWSAYTQQKTSVQPSAAIRRQPASIIIAAVTLSAGVILAAVAVHMLMN